jgi:hypothetical protein
MRIRNRAKKGYIIISLSLTFDHLTALDHMRVGMVNGHIEAQRLKQNILVADQFLGL